MLQAPITAVLICTLVVDDHRLDAAPRGTGVLVSAHATGVRAKALTHATAKWPWLAELAGPGRHVLRLSYGRGDGTDLPAESELAAVALADAAELLGVALRPADVVDRRWCAGRRPCRRPDPAMPRRCEALRARLDSEHAGHRRCRRRRQRAGRCGRRCPPGGGPAARTAFDELHEAGCSDGPVFCIAPLAPTADRIPVDG